MCHSEHVGESQSLPKFLFMNSLNSLPFNKFFDNLAKSYSCVITALRSSSLFSGSVATAALLVLSIRV